MHVDVAIKSTTDLKAGFPITYSEYFRSLRVVLGEGRTARRHGGYQCGLRIATGFFRRLTRCAVDGAFFERFNAVTQQGIC